VITNRTARVVLLALLQLALVALPAECFAQPPMYEPYGAWRGRIRYHEGPFGGVRTRIHWGGGITPVGGQVLMHLGTVAGNVFTNPNTLGALAGAAGGARNAEVDPELIAAIGALGPQNARMLDDLNAVRKSVGLASVAFPTPAVIPPPGDGTLPNGDILALGSQWNTLKTTVENRRQEIRRDAQTAIAVGDGAAATLAPPQVEQLKLLKERLILTAVLTEGVVNLPLLDRPATPEEFDIQLKNVREDWKQLGEVLVRTIDVGRQLLAADPSADEDNGLTNQIGNFERFLGEVQAISP
jgi:hypothetical protein